MDILKVYLLLLLFGFGVTENILITQPFNSKSHYITLRPIGLELARRGHNVTIITSNKEKNPPPNYHEIMADNTTCWELTGTKRPNVFTMVSLSAEEFHDKILWGAAGATTEAVLKSKAVKEFLATDHKFDLVISEQFFQEALYILAYKYQAPLILATTFGNCMRHNIVTRNPLQLATVTAEFLDVKDPKSFWGRLRNLYFTFYEFFWWTFWFLERNEQLVKKYLPDLPKPIPSLYEMQKNASLILLNSHFSFDPPTAYLPNQIEVGGLHLAKSDTKLPKDLQKILDDAKNGVVYVSFGSNIQSSELPDSKKEAFLKVFRHLNQTILWKWEDDNFENKLQNLIVRKWFPQKDILAHPNVKVFIGHGGLIGTQEAIFNGVPIVGIPIYCDQYNNLLQAEEKGFGRILKYEDIERDLEKILTEVLNNKSYTEKAMEISRRFRDRPMSALDTAVFWIEYVMRHKGAPFMRNPALDLSWFAYTMLDVYAFIALIVFISVYVSVKIVKILLSFLLSNKNVKKYSKQKKN